MKERKEQLLTLMKDPSYVPMKLKELAILLDVPKERREELAEVLDVLVAEGKLSLSKRGKYKIPEASVLAGIYSGTARGFGFVSIDGWQQDVFVPASGYPAPQTHSFCFSGSNPPRFGWSVLVPVSRLPPLCGLVFGTPHRSAPDLRAWHFRSCLLG